MTPLSALPHRASPAFLQQADSVRVMVSPLQQIENTRLTESKDEAAMTETKEEGLKRKSNCLTT